MAKVLVTRSSLESIADAIRAKGVEGNFKPGEMAAAIESIPGSESYIAKPFVTAPLGPAVPNDGFTVSGTQFTPVGAEDTHYRTKYRFYSGASLALEYATTTDPDLTSHTFTYAELSTLVPGTYDLRIQYTGLGLGDSQESEPVRIKLVNGIISPRGRLVYRHESNKGSVIVYDNFGLPASMLVYDASYRVTGVRWLSANEPVTGMKQWNHSYYPTCTSNRIDTDYGFTNLNSREDITPFTDKMTDAHLQAAMAETYVPVMMTAKDGTDKLLAAGGSTAAQYVRALDVPIQAQIPNAYQGLILWTEGDVIDSLDPTLTSSIKAMALGKYTNSYRWLNNTHAWSSTECNNTQAARLTAGYYLATISKNVAMGVVPIAEL